MKIFNLHIDYCDYDSIINRIRSAIESKRKITVNYVNANSVRFIRKDPCLIKVMNNSNILHSDGFGIALAAKILSPSASLKTFNWTDHSKTFLHLCETEGWSIFFLGAPEEIIKLAVSNVKLMFPKLKIVGALNGFDAAISDECIDKINNARPDILWVGMGTPKQELWLCNNKEKLDCFVIQSVGDIFSYLADKRWRGPLLLRNLGFEWIVRLLQNPIKYFNRYIIGIPVFIFIILREKLFIERNEETN
ncbi:MAG: hypothetical protein C0412_18115 [Flavobacterium sp.]|nr:hypothetical protein [Flavobacterium sp.]